MISTRSLAVLFLGIVLLAPVIQAEDLSRYREFQFRTNLVSIAKQTGTKPATPFRPQAEFILGLHAEVEKQKGIVKVTQAIVTERVARIKELQDMNSGSYAAQIDNLKTSVKERDERIRERDNSIRRLKEELEKLKKIDKERRPLRPGQ